MAPCPLPRPHPRDEGFDLAPQGLRLFGKLGRSIQHLTRGGASIVGGAGDPGNAARDLLGTAGSLGGEVLHSEASHREALAGTAGRGRFNGGLRATPITLAPEETGTEALVTAMAGRRRYFLRGWAKRSDFPCIAAPMVPVAAAVFGLFCLGFFSSRLLRFWPLLMARSSGFG